MKTEMEIIKENYFTKLYDTITSRISDIYFLNSIMINYDGANNIITVDYGKVEKFDLNKEITYEVITKIISIVLDNGREVPEEVRILVDEVVSKVRRESDESVETIFDVKIHFIPTSKKCVVLTRKPLEFTIGEDHEELLASVISHVLICREDSNFCEDEKRANELYEQFYERVDEISEDQEQDLSMICHHRFTKGGKELTLQMIVNRDRNTFFTLVLDNSTIVHSSYRNYNTPSTLNILAWDFVNFTK